MLFTTHSDALSGGAWPGGRLISRSKETIIKKPKLRTAYVLAFVALTALICPTLSQATVIDVNLTFDLNNSLFGSNPDFPREWGTGFISFPEVNPVVGDTLRISIFFVDQSTNQPQRLRVSDLGIGEPIERVQARADGEPTLSLVATQNNSFTFHNVIGDIFSNPVSVLTTSSGSGIGASALANMTNTAFSFTGITWQIVFSVLTYDVGDGFNLAAFFMGADEIEVIQPVPEPVKVELVVPDPRATQPAINDLGEIVYVRDGTIISTTRGPLVSGVDASNIGISNSGEVVHADGGPTSQVTSTVRGTLVASRSFAPTISATTGEVAYQSGIGDTNFFTTFQGQVESFDRTIFSVGVGDVNDGGEVVFELRDLSIPNTQLYSTVRGFLTPPTINAIQPAINNLSEVVWSGFDAFDRQQIFSSIRGQLTFFGGSNSFSTADLPDIDNNGTVVFRGVLNGVAGIYTAAVPEPSTILDHFLSYKVRRTKRTPKFEKQEVILTDQFESDVLFKIKKVKKLYNPADKDGEGIIDLDTHLVGYEIKRAKGEPKHKKRTNIEVVNQFGTIFVDTKKPDRLLVPSLKDLDNPIPDIDVPDEFLVDHFKCYKVKVSEGSEFPEGIQVDVVDQFNQPKLFNVKKPERLCNPVDKNGEGVINPDAHLMCYKIRRAKGEPKHIKVKGIHTNNQFGPLQVDTKKEAELCVPSTKTIQ